MTHFTVHPIGTICHNEEGTFLKLDKTFIPALKALNGFSHINVLWWFSKFDDEQSRSVLQAEQPYKEAPEVMGIFATRSPIRPNPLALTTAEVIHIDYERGLIQLSYHDADNGTPVLDIKPYTPSYDRVENPLVPAWCSRWPKNTETSGDFDWDEVFNF